MWAPIDSFRKAKAFVELVKLKLFQRMSSGTILGLTGSWTMWVERITCILVFPGLV